MCEGAGQDSGYGHEESHLIHDSKYSMVSLHLIWNVVCRVCVSLHVHLGGK